VEAGGILVAGVEHQVPLRTHGEELVGLARHDPPADSHCVEFGARDRIARLYPFETDSAGYEDREGADQAQQPQTACGTEGRSA